MACSRKGRSHERRKKVWRMRGSYEESVEGERRRLSKLEIKRMTGRQTEVIIVGHAPQPAI